jgi:hypothetical protein
MVEEKGGVVCIYLIDDNEFQWRSTVRSRCPACHDELAHGRGDVWHCDDRTGKDYVNLCPKDCTVVLTVIMTSVACA